MLQEIPLKLKVDKSVAKKKAETRARALISSIKSNPSNASVYAAEILMLNHAYGLPESLMAELAALEQDLEIKKFFNMAYVETQMAAQNNDYKENFALISVGLGLVEDKLNDIDTRLDRLAAEVGVSMDKAASIRKKKRETTDETAISALDDEYKVIITEACSASSDIYVDLKAILDVVRELEAKINTMTTDKTTPDTAKHHNLKELNERLAHIKGHLKQTQEKFDQVMEPVKEEIAAYFIEKSVLEKNKDKPQAEKDKLVEAALKVGLSGEQKDAIEDYVLEVSGKDEKARVQMFDELIMKLNSLEEGRSKHVSKVLIDRQSISQQDKGLNI